MSQYFENDDNVLSLPKDTHYWVGAKCLTFKTDHGVFSYGEIDDASAVLIKKGPPCKGRVLDLGCGYGFIGITLKTMYPSIELYQSDINERALDLCKANCLNNGIVSIFVLSDGFESIEDSFDCIYLNPPIHAGKDICRKLITDSIKHLTPGGVLAIVIRKKHGAKSYLKWFTDNRISYEIVEKKDDIYVINLHNSN